MNCGCKLGIMSSNVIAYADDLVILAPSCRALQSLIDVAVKEVYSIKLEINDQKSKCMIFRHKYSKKYSPCKKFEIDGKPVDFCHSFRYLGYIVMSNLKNDEDISRAVGKFYSEFNVILRKFNFTEPRVKLLLFKQYCLQIYGCEFWVEGYGSSSDIKQFGIGYHKAIKKLLGLSYHESNHFACQEANLMIFKHFLNVNKILSVLRLFRKPCIFVQKCLIFLYVSSILLKDVHQILEKDYNVDSVFDNDADALIARICFVQNHERQMREG